MNIIKQSFLNHCFKVLGIKKQYRYVLNGLRLKKVEKWLIVRQVFTIFRDTVCQKLNNKVESSKILAFTW